MHTLIQLLLATMCIEGNCRFQGVVYSYIILLFSCAVYYGYNSITFTFHSAFSLYISTGIYIESMAYTIQYTHGYAL